MRKSNVPTFRGDADPEKTDKWIRDIEHNFQVFYIPDDMKRVLVVQFLVGNAKTWWEGATLVYLGEDEILTCEVFRRTFLDYYSPNSLKMEKEKVFFNLKQIEGMTVVEYAHKFNSLGKFVPR